MYTTDYMDAQFIEEFKLYAEKSYLRDESLIALSYPNATILPFKNGRGGVLDEQGKYIEDSALKAESIMYGLYDINSYSSINERVIYLGCFIKQWGHFLVDFIPRLWYLIDGIKDCRLAYVSVNNSQIDGVYEDLLNLFGVNSKRLICIKDVTKFEDVVVPQTAYDRPNFYYKEYGDIFKHIVERLKKQNISFPYYERIYWTRTKLRKARHTEIGEKQIERLFEANGYKILAPERLSLLEQVYYFSTCPKMAGISGSIPHNLVFSGRHTEMIIINRTYRINVNQFPINEMCGGKIIHIDGHASFLPNSADKGPFWIVYNENLEKFALDNKFDVPQSILRSKGKVRKKDFNKYCTTYFNTYTGSELEVKDAGIAGSILGRSRPLAENIEEHEIYYYYRKQFGQINNKNQIIKASKQFIKNAMKKVGR